MFNLSTLFQFSPPMDRIPTDETVVISLEEVGSIEREMLVAGDISIDGTKILLRRAHSKGK